MGVNHAECVYCGSHQCACFDTDEEYEEAMAERRREWRSCPTCGNVCRRPDESYGDGGGI